MAIIFEASILAQENKRSYTVRLVAVHLLIIKSNIQASFKNIYLLSLINNGINRKPITCNRLRNQ